MNPQLLRDFPFFEHLDDEYLAEISKLCSERTYIKGESIFLKVISLEQVKPMTQELYCEGCGSMSPQGTRYCARCGRALRIK